MEAAVLAAANHLLKHLSQPQELRSWHKADQSVVTNLDIECQELMLKVLGTGLPSVSEEDPATHAHLNVAPAYYLIDPLDGTSSFRRYRYEKGGQIGFGPMLGLALEKKITACCFYHLLWGTLFTAIKGAGTWSLPIRPNETLPSLQERKQLLVEAQGSLGQAAFLFFPGKGGELQLVEHLKGNHIIDNAYRFGGFASDCVRLACGREQIHFQSAVKPWDLSAALLESEAGLSVTIDPLGAACPLYDWVISANNPVFASVKAFHGQLLQYMRQVCHIV